MIEYLGCGRSGVVHLVSVCNSISVPNMIWTKTHCGFNHAYKFGQEPVCGHNKKSFSVLFNILHNNAVPNENNNL